MLCTLEAPNVAQMLPKNKKKLALGALKPFCFYKPFCPLFVFRKEADKQIRKQYASSHMTKVVAGLCHVLLRCSFCADRIRSPIARTRVAKAPGLSRSLSCVAALQLLR